MELLPTPSYSSGVPVPDVQPLLLLPLPSLPLPQDPRSWRGPRWAEDQARDLSRFLGGQVGKGSLAMLSFDPLPSQWFPNFPLQVWDPFPSPSCPSGAPVPSRLHFSSPLTPHHSPHPTRSLGVPPIPFGVRGPPPVPGRCPSCAETRILHPSNLPSSLLSKVVYFNKSNYLKISLNQIMFIKRNYVFKDTSQK